MNHPMPASPLPWKSEGGNSHDVAPGCEPVGYQSLIDAKGAFVADFEWRSREDRAEQDCDYAEWAANNAPKLAERVAALEAELERVRSALNGYRDSDLASLAESIMARNFALESAVRVLREPKGEPT